MSLIEDRYQEAIGRMTGPQRLERVCSLFSALREMLTLKVKREHVGLSDREIRRKVAEQLYLSDPTTQALLRRIR